MIFQRLSRWLSCTIVSTMTVVCSADDQVTEPVASRREAGGEIQRLLYVTSRDDAGRNRQSIGGLSTNDRLRGSAGRSILSRRC